MKIKIKRERREIILQNEARMLDACRTIHITEFEVPANQAAVSERSRCADYGNGRGKTLILASVPAVNDYHE